MYDSLLVGTDGSVTAAEAVRRAVELGRVCDATVHVVFVGASERAEDVLR